MKQNVGGYDRLLRILVGLGGIFAGYVYNLWWVAIVAAIILLTGVFGWCGLYTVCSLCFKPAKKTASKKTKKAKTKKKK